MTKRLDRGEVSAESVIILPVMFGMIWLVVQAAVVINAGNAAHYVASQAALAAARHGSTMASADAALMTATESVGARLARAPRFDWADAQVTVHVEVVVPRAAPFFGETVTRSVTAPRERFIEYAER
ncbi:MAG: hypothetical protein RLZZ284_156 [Actinomycetota bacterium]